MFFGKHHDDDDTVVAMLASALRRDISFGVLEPDQKLKIEVLRQRYGGSNHSMRETLRLLSAEGIVEATSQRGFRVTSATENDRQDILLIRLEIEQLGLARSLARSNVEWEGRVIAAFHTATRADIRVQQSPDDLTALEWDEAARTVSAAIMSACGSPRIIDLAEKFFNQSRRFRLALLREGRIDFAARKARRDALQDAILTRETERALALLEEEITADIGGKTN
jgi:GntR family transcriptional regulator, carbon starvation induced regulator